MDKQWDRELKKISRQIDSDMRRGKKLERDVRALWRRQLSTRDDAEKGLHRLRRRAESPAQTKRLKLVENKLKALEIKAFLGALKEL